MTSISSLGSLGALAGASHVSNNQTSSTTTGNNFGPAYTLNIGGNSPSVALTYKKHHHVAVAISPPAALPGANGVGSLGLAASAGAGAAGGGGGGGK